jgi:hypothetical protein
METPLDEIVSREKILLKKIEYGMEIIKTEQERLGKFCFWKVNSKCPESPEGKFKKKCLNYKNGKCETYYKLFFNTKYFSY